MWARQLSTERKITAGFAVALTILLVMGAVSYRSIRILIEESGWVAHTDHVLDKLDEVLSDLRDAETGQRGYIITGDQSYLKPYQSALTAVRQHLNDVRNLTADNLSQQQRLDTLEARIAARLAQLKKGIDAESEGGHEAGAAAVLQGLGATPMGDIRKAIDEMKNEERRLLNSRRTETKAYAQRTIFIIGLGSFPAFALVGLVSFIIHGDLSNRRRAEELLRKAKEELETRVRERAVANEALLAEVAQRQRTEQALVQEKYLLDALMDNVPDLIYFKDGQSRFTRVNKAQAFWLGVDGPALAVGKTDSDFFSAGHYQQARADEQQIMTTGSPLLGIEEMETWPGRPDTWVLTSKMPLRDAEGRVVGTFGISRDITERKRVEELLRKAHDELEARVQDRTAELTKANEALRAEVAERHRIEEELVQEQSLFHALMESIPDVVYFEDAACRFMKINKAQAKLLGVNDPKEAIGKTDFDFFPPDVAREFFASEQKLLQSGQPMLDHIQKVVTPDGQVQWHSATEVPIFDAQGKVLGLVGISRDITERKLAEVELQKAKEAAEASSRAKSEFLANMSHEIRTPMNGILGMTELTLDTELAPEQRQYLEMVKSSADSLLTVINDILDFSRIEAGKLELDAIEFNLRDNLDDTLKALALRAHQKGLELACHIQPGVPKVLSGDPGRLRQITVNLVGNAIKFTEAGEVVVEAGIESQEEGATRLHFTIRDTGIGIAAEKQKLVFDAFAQADGSTTRRYGGTGLGLSIASRLVEMMQGRIWVESEVGRGSTFHFTARFGVAKAPWTLPPAAEPAQLEDLSVLVVDDNATNRNILKETLASWRMKPVLADSGPKALLALEQAWESGKPFHLVLTDAHMPEMDGFMLAERIKHHQHLAGATIMMLTSGGQRGDAARCRDLGVAAYLTKPIGQSELLDAILRVFAAAPQKTEPLAVVTRHSLREARQALRILLAEDNPVNQRLATRLLEKRGHTVVVAGTGREALAALGRETFDLALMDVQMPDMDGLEATSAIREQEKVTGKHLPVVAMTAHAMVGDRERFLAAGMDGYVSKPIKTQDLFDAIKELIPSSSEAGAEELTTLG